MRVTHHPRRPGADAGRYCLAPPLMRPVARPGEWPVHFGARLRRSAIAVSDDGRNGNVPHLPRAGFNSQTHAAPCIHQATSPR